MNYLKSHNKVWRPRFDLVAHVSVPEDDLITIGCKKGQTIMTQIWEERNGTMWLRVFDKETECYIGHIKLDIE